MVVLVHVVKVPVKTVFVKIVKLLIMKNSCVEVCAG